MLTLSSARALAETSIQEAQRKYKAQHDAKPDPVDYAPGDLVLVYFPQEESGAHRKLSRPWHVPYRIISVQDPDVTAAKMYFPQDLNIQVHQSRVCPCPVNFPSGFYWYGTRRRRPGRPPKKIDNILQGSSTSASTKTHLTQIYLSRATEQDFYPKKMPLPLEKQEGQSLLMTLESSYRTGGGDVTRTQWEQAWSLTG